MSSLNHANVAPTQVARTMFLQIGRRRYQVASFEQASQMFCAARDKALANMRSASKIGEQFIVDEAGAVIARISYNGRVWGGAEYQPDATPLYPTDGGYVPLARASGGCRHA